MHCPKVFREERLDVIHGLMRAHPLATLITAGGGGLVANLIPFSLHDGGHFGILRAHFAGGNRQLEALREGAEVLVLFQGPDCYVTPSWYPSKGEHGKVVPTWNFAMVQARGVAQVIDEADWLLQQVEQLTNDQELRRAHSWKVSDAPADFIAAQLKGIVGIEIRILSIEGKWKISQNRQSADYQGVVEGLRAEGCCPSMAGLMAGE